MVDCLFYNDIKFCDLHWDNDSFISNSKNYVMIISSSTKLNIDLEDEVCILFNLLRNEHTQTKTKTKM